MGSFECEKCYKSFTTMRSLRHHIANVNCTRVNHQCSDCLKGFSSKQRLESHIENRVCLRNGQAQVAQKSQEKVTLNANNNTDSTATLSFEQQIALEQMRMARLKLELEVVSQKNANAPTNPSINAGNNLNMNNGNNNTNNNNNTQINTLAFNRDNFDLCLAQNPSYLLRAANKPQVCAQELTGMVYCDKNNPNNQSVYIPNRTPSIAMVCDGETYTRRDAKETVKEIYDQCIGKIDEFIDENPNSLTEFKKKAHKDRSKDEEFEKKAKRAICLKLTDMEPVIKDRQKTQKAQKAQNT